MDPPPEGPRRGGDPVQLTRVEENVESGHVWPVFLPDGKSFFFLADAPDDAGHRLKWRNLAGDQEKILATVIRSNLAVDPRGALLLVRDTSLIAYPFDVDSKRAWRPGTGIVGRL